jgi:thiamine-phosphate pyrophosphorylase
MTLRSDIRRWRLCLVLDRALAGARPYADIVSAAIAGGVDAVQFRDKQSDGRRLLEDAIAVGEVCRQNSIPFLVNDRVDLALAADADGAHVGQDDIPAAAARRLLGPDRILGVSVRSAEEARRAAADGADYLGVGPIFEARGSKPDAAPPISLAGLSAVWRITSLPILAIGGIHAGSAAAVIRAGATGVAVISAILSAADATAAARTLKDKLDTASADS